MKPGRHDCARSGGAQDGVSVVQKCVDAATVPANEIAAKQRWEVALRCASLQILRVAGADLVSKHPNWMCIYRMSLQRGGLGPNFCTDNLRPQALFDRQRRSRLRFDAIALGMVTGNRKEIGRRAKVGGARRARRAPIWLGWSGWQRDAKGSPPRYRQGELCQAAHLVRLRQGSRAPMKAFDLRLRSRRSVPT